jgi:NDP-sugar pyrophosphorylase family protein
VIPALVLTAGLATRLRPLSLVRAKAALPVAGEALVRRILRQLAAAGVPGAVLNLHHLPHTITRVVGDGADLGIPVRYSWENPVLGSAGGPRRALPLLAGLGARASASPFFIVNGDTLTDAPLGALQAAHEESSALVTLGVVPNTQPSKYGGILAGTDLAATGVATRGAGEPSWHFIGVQVASPEAFASVPHDVPWESVGALYPALMRDRPGSVRIFPMAARFHDIGTPADYLETSQEFSSVENGSSHRREGIHATARVERSVIWDDVEVEAGAALDQCVVMDGVRVPANTSWRQASLRLAAGEPMASEQRIGDLFVAPIDGLRQG